MPSLISDVANIGILSKLSHVMKSALQSGHLGSYPLCWTEHTTCFCSSSPVREGPALQGDAVQDVGGAAVPEHAGLEAARGGALRQLLAPGQVGAGPQDAQRPGAQGMSDRVARWQNLIPSFPWIALGWRAQSGNPVGLSAEKTFLSLRTKGEGEK